MKNLITHLLLILFSICLVGQERVTDFENLAESSLEYKDVSIQETNGNVYFIEKSSSKIRVSLIEGQSVSELYTLEDFPTNQGNGTIHSVESAISPHQVHEGYLYEFFKDQIRRRDLSTGEIINTWMIPETDLYLIKEVEFHGQFCFLRNYSGHFGYLNTQNGELKFIDNFNSELQGTQNLNENHFIVENGKIYYADLFNLFEYDPLTTEVVSFKNLSFAYSHRYQHLDGTDQLIIVESGVGISIFDGTDNQTVSSLDVSAEVTGIFNSDLYTALVTGVTDYRTLRVVNNQTQEVIFEEIIEDYEFMSAIDKNDLDGVHYIIQFTNYSSLTFLFNSLSGEISEINSFNFNDKILKSSTLNDGPFLYLITKNNSENFTPDYIDLGYNFMKINKEELSIENISDRFSDYPYGTYWDNSRSIAITRNSKSFILNEFVDEDQITPFHESKGYRSIGYDQINYLAQWGNNILLQTEDELQLIGDELIASYNGKVTSADQTNGIANGLLVHEDTPYYFRLDMISGEIHLQELPSDHSIGNTQQTSGGIFGDFTIEESLFFDLNDLEFKTLPVSDDITQFYTSDDKILLQTEENNTILLHLFDGQELVSIPEAFGSDISVVSKKDGTFIILDQDNDEHTLYFIDQNGAIKSSISVDGERILPDDEYLTSGALSVFIYEGQDFINTILSMNGEFQLYNSDLSPMVNPKYKYAKGNDGILIDVNSIPLTLIRWNQQKTPIEIDENEILISSVFNQESIKLLTYKNDLFLYEIDINTGQNISREHVNSVDNDVLSYGQNRLYRLNNNQQYILTPGVYTSNSYTSLKFLDLQELSSDLLHHVLGGEPIRDASAYIYTDNYLYCKALKSFYPPNYQIYRIPTDGVTSTKPDVKTQEHSLEIHPNFSPHQIVVQESLQDIKIINQSNGFIKELNNSYPMQTIPISNLLNGIYYIQGKSEDGSIKTGEFIKISAN